jgi:hypothetical protein
MKSTIYCDITPCGPLKVQQIFRKNILPPFSESKNKLITLFGTYLHTGILLGLFFEPENGRDIFLRNVCWLSTLISHIIVLYYCTTLLEVMIWANHVSFRPQQGEYYDLKIEAVSNKPKHRVWNFLWNGNSRRGLRRVTKHSEQRDEDFWGGYSTEIAAPVHPYLARRTVQGSLMDIRDVTNWASISSQPNR